ncbi:LysR family transcriptional regulator [Pseudoflavonifractor sp. 60]|uniref:LysR substrate-binding domain-containing protein n=1 Tax=Pseudoflavonifractor sp. 60 TaxID=2304576 RepID=UPI00136FB155|nr:LysR family transcriptional regulator [Pseudoflavonifractor sp. 60]
MTNYREYIYAVYQEKSFSKAAKKLFVSQPWLSAAIKKAEQELGLALFDRSTSPISLTEAGRYYIAKYEEIAAIEEEMREHFRQIRDVERTELHIGSSMFFCTYVLPGLMEEFQLLYPQVTLTLTEGGNKTLVEKLMNGQLDFLLEAERPANNRVHSIPWASEEIVLAVPAGNPVNEKLTAYRYCFTDFLSRTQTGNRRPPVPLEAFSQEKFLLLKEGNDIHQRSLQMCKHTGFSPKVSLYLAQMMTAYYLVLEGQGIAFLRSTIPAHVAPTDRVVFYQLGDPLAVRSIYLSYTPQNANPVKQHLVDFMKDNIL